MIISNLINVISLYKSRTPLRWVVWKVSFTIFLKSNYLPFPNKSPYCKLSGLTKQEGLCLNSFLILPFLNIDPFIFLSDQTATNFEKFLYGLLVMTILELWLFISVVGYLISLYIVNYTKIEEKYPKLRKIVNYYKKTNYFFILFEALLFILMNLGLIYIYLDILFLTS